MSQTYTKLNSSLYKCKVFHSRQHPKKHTFRNSIYMFYLDLDEINSGKFNSFLLNHNRFGLHSFYEKDHFAFYNPKIKEENLKDNIIKYANENKVRGITKVFLLTNLRVLGYVFNPVSFYFCYDTKDKLLCIISEVNNTFSEQRRYFVKVPKTKQAKRGNPTDFHNNNKIKTEADKFFYVSPFIAPDTRFEFSFSEPDENFQIYINSKAKNQMILKAGVTGKRKILNKKNLLKSFLISPLVTFKIITLIHWHALILFLKRIKFYRKKQADATIRQNSNETIYTNPKKNPSNT
jgi:DUF1365 family protein